MSKQPTPTEAYWRGKHVVYRMYEDGRLLYVGMSRNLPERIRTHRDHVVPSYWWHRHAVDRVVVRILPTREAAREAEIAAIRDEAPRYNVLNNPHIANEDRRFPLTLA